MKWIEIVENKTKSIGKKTKVFDVMTKETKNLIGEIRWYGHWRQYSFCPKGNTVFEPTCLNDISAFIKKLMDERKPQPKVNKELNAFQTEVFRYINPSLHALENGRSVTPGSPEHNLLKDLFRKCD
jgi:hypothetical protein